MVSHSNTWVTVKRTAYQLHVQSSTFLYYRNKKDETPSLGKIIQAQNQYLLVFKAVYILHNSSYGTLMLGYGLVSKAFFSMSELRKVWQCCRGDVFGLQSWGLTVISVGAIKGLDFFRRSLWTYMHSSNSSPVVIGHSVQTQTQYSTKTFAEQSGVLSPSPCVLCPPPNSSRRVGLLCWRQQCLTRNKGGLMSATTVVLSSHGYNQKAARSHGVGALHAKWQDAELRAASDPR